MPIHKDYYSPSMKASGLVRTPARATASILLNTDATINSNAATIAADDFIAGGASPPNADRPSTARGGGGTSPSPQQSRSRQGGAAPPATRIAADGALVVSSAAGNGGGLLRSPANTKRSALEAEHESELLQRQDVHHRLINATEGRRDRAHAILDMHRTEIVQLEELIRQCEGDTAVLEGLRRDLSDALRRQEVVAYRATKDLKLLKQEEQTERIKQQIQQQHRLGLGTAAASAAGIGGPAGLLSAASGISMTSPSPWAKAAIGTVVGGSSGYPLSVTSPLRTLFGSGGGGSAASTAASILSAPSSGPAVMLFPHLSHDPALHTSSFDLLAQRLQEARRVASALERECAENEAALAQQRKERGAVKDLIAVAESHIKDLEAEGPATLDALRSAQAKLRTAAEHAQLLPDMRRMVEDNAVTLNLQKQSSAATIKALMEVIKSDDGKLVQLRRAHGGSAAAALELNLGGGDDASSSSPSRVGGGGGGASPADGTRAAAGLTYNALLAASMSPSRGAAAGAASSLGGGAFATSTVGKIANDVEAENRAYGAALAEIVRRAEEQRAQLQATADTLSSRARYLEDRLVRVRA